jgi:hypothetical protein
MTTSGMLLPGFAYGEDLEGLPPRSLGYRLLAPLEPTPWSNEVEALARRLQGAPYPEHWPLTDLFCSVLLDGGQRLVALARYGLADHTPSRRRGGLELIGVVAPIDLDIRSALAIYRWLLVRRQQAGDDLHSLGKPADLAEAQASAEPVVLPRDPVPILPIRLWQEGALLFAATAPSDPDHRLALLEQGAGHGWQWLPLVGEDFPLGAYAQRGPLIAWTPHLAGVALRVGGQPTETRSSPPSLWNWTATAAIGSLLILLLVLAAANLWTVLGLHRRVVESRPAAVPQPVETAPVRPAPPPVSSAGGASEPFAEALHDLLLEQMDRRDWSQLQEVFLVRYERVSRQHPDLRLPDSCPRGRLAVGAVSVLSQGSPNRLAEIIRKALSNRGYDPVLVNAAAERVQQQLLSDARAEGP